MLAVSLLAALAAVIARLRPHLRLTLTLTTA
jgi:hypothetical protein